VVVGAFLGRHGMAIMAVREGLEFESAITSDSASVADPTLALIEHGIEVHCLRDLTRGGLTAALHEIATAAQLGIEIQEAAVPVRPDVAAACEVLGLDPFQVACEGRFVAFVPPEQADETLAILRRHPVSEAPAVIGRVTATPRAMVLLASRIGIPHGHSVVLPIPLHTKALQVATILEEGTCKRSSGSQRPCSGPRPRWCPDCPRPRA